MSFIGFSYQQISFTNSYYEVKDSGAQIQFTMPLSIITADNSLIRITTSMDSKIGAGTHFHITPDDCLEELSVNGTAVIKGIPFCNFINGSEINLNDYINSDQNTLVAVIRNSGGPAKLAIELPKLHPIRVISFALLALGLSALSIIFIRRVRRVTSWSPFDAVIASGVFLRTIYLAGTSYNERGYDAEGHVAYIKHVLETWNIPAIGDGWQFYQPPLYYILAAIPASNVEWLGADQSTFLLFIQLFSLVLSVGSLIIAGWIISMVFPHKKQRSFAIIAFAFFAFFPATNFFAARINNDVLLEFLSLLCIGFLMQWWIDKKNSWWYASALTFGLVLLTKNNALLIAPILGICLIVKPHLQFRIRLKLATISILIITILNAPYMSKRVFEGQKNIVGNLSELGSELKIEPSWTNAINFNPIRVISHAYNDPWNDESGRQFFLEYLYKSAFTGEFSFGEHLKPLVSLLLFLGMIMTAFSGFGLWQIALFKRMELLPIWIIPIILLAGHILFRQLLAPYSCSQDFRYSILLVLPWAILVAYGINYISQQKKRWPHILFWSYVTCCALLISIAGNI